MTSKQKIITMARLAVYDKNEGDADRLANDYFRHDYIYRKNMATRFCSGVGAGILVAVYWLRMFLLEGADLFESDLSALIWNSAGFIIAVMAVYTVIGTVQGTRQYYLIQKRLKRYSMLTHQLERINERTRRLAERQAEEQDLAESQSAEGASDLLYGTDTDRKGSNR